MPRLPRRPFRMDDHLPLAGVRVVSIAINVPGPVAASRLASLGASVTKVEPPTGDPLARSAPRWYAELVAGQRVVTLDLKAPADRARFAEALVASDVLLVSSRPGALARLGLDRAALAAAYPALCTVSIVGHATPHADLAGHDLTYQAEAGLVTPPAMPATLFSDMATGIEAVAAALALLVARARTGHGGWREVSLRDTAAALAAPRRHGLTAPDGVLGGAFAGYALYEARDGWIALAALEPQFRARLMTILDLPTLDGAVLARRVREQPVAEWVALGRSHDIPIAAVAAP